MTSQQLSHSFFLVNWSNSQNYVHNFKFVFHVPIGKIFWVTLFNSSSRLGKKMKTCSRLKGNYCPKKVKLKWKTVKNAKKVSHHWPQCAKSFLRYPIPKSAIWVKWTSPSCGFLASFSLKYDVTAQAQSCKTMKNWKCNISEVFSSIRLKFCGLLEVSNRILLDFKFRCYGNLTRE